MSGIDWNPKVHSKKKLGHALTIPVAPMRPVAAQVSPRGIHLQMDAEGSYLTTSSDVVPPGRIKAVQKALQQLKAEDKMEPSYSGTGTKYYPLTVHDVDGRADLVELHVGDAVFCRVVIDPDATIVSSDEPMEAQTDDEAEDDEAEKD